MTAPEILTAIEEAGGRVDLAGDRLRVRAPQPLIEQAKIRKGDILRILSQPSKSNRTQSWVIGLVCCLGCKGTWHSEPGFKTHLLVCRFSGSGE